MNISDLGIVRVKSDRRRYAGLNESTMRKLDRLDSSELRELSRELARSGADPVRQQYVDDSIAILKLADPPTSSLVWMHWSKP